MTNAQNGEDMVGRATTSPQGPYEQSKLQVDWEHLVTWTPFAFLLLVLPFYVRVSRYDKLPSLSLSRLGTLKVWLAGFQSWLECARLTMWVVVGLPVWESTDIEDPATLCVVRAGSYILTIWIVKLTRSRGAVNCVPLFLFWGLSLVAESLQLYRRIGLQTQPSVSNPVQVMPFLRWLSVVLQFLLASFADHSAVDSDRFPKGRGPAERASIPSLLTLSWMDRMLWKVYKTEVLLEEDLPELEEKQRSSFAHEEFKRKWTQAQRRTDKSKLDSAPGKFSMRGEEDDKGEPDEKRKKDDKGEKDKGEETVSESPAGEESQRSTTKVPSLLRVILRLYGVRLIVFEVLILGLDLSTFLHPLLTEAHIKHVQNRSEESEWRGYMLVAALLLHSVMETGLQSWLNLGRNRMMDSATSAMHMALLKKTLSIKQTGKGSTGTGDLINLMESHSHKFLRSGHNFFSIAIIPLKVMLSLYLLYFRLGVGAFAGLTIMLLLLPVNSWVAARLLKIHGQRTELRDKRTKALTELLNGIKAIKLYAWEEPFIKKIKDIWNSEMALKSKIAITESGLTVISRAVPFLVRVCSFALFIYMNGQLQPSTAFVAISLFQKLNRPLNDLVFTLPSVTEGKIAYRKLQDFLTKADAEEYVVHKELSDEGPAAAIEDGTFTWEAGRSQATLTDVNLSVPEGGLVAIVGAVGAGKSSLLSALLGEIDRLSGHVLMKGHTAYVAQEAWILRATVKENILFGSSVSPDMYQQTIRACALTHDLKLLVDGEDTLLGEKGVTLSGGQKQRVSLARAVYSQADTYLLDDPLSAVDSYVGKHIFQNVIGPEGMLRNKTRILVTHGLQWLPQADLVVVMKDGQIVETGTYAQLLAADGDLARLLRDRVVREDETGDKTSEDDNTSVKLDEDEGGSGSEEQNSRAPELTALLVPTIDTAGPETVLRKRRTGPTQDSQKTPGTSYSRQNSLTEYPTETEGLEGEEPEENTGSDISLEEKKKSGKDSKKSSKSGKKKHGTASTLALYFRAAGIYGSLLVVLMFVLQKSVNNMQPLWLARWTDDQRLANSTMSTESRAANWWYLSVYGVAGFVKIVGSVTFEALLHQQERATTNAYHDRLLNNIMRCPMSFFETTPTGSLISTFNKDIWLASHTLHQVRSSINASGDLLISLMMVIYFTPGILPCLAIVSVLYAFLNVIFRKNSTLTSQLSRDTHSRIFTTFKETTEGAVSIRAFGSKQKVMNDMACALDADSRLGQTRSNLNIWYNLRLAFLSELVEALSRLLLLWDLNMAAGLTGAVLGYGTDAMYCVRRFVRIMSQQESHMVATECLEEYSTTATEAPWYVDDGVSLVDWTQSQDISLDCLTTRYKEGLPLVLRGLSCTIQPGEKIGVVGRTGAGKSSLALALFRIIEAASGQIKVSEQDTRSLGLHDLRRNLTILPQDPVVFAGTLRANLDPFGEKSSEELWDALEHAHLKSFVESLPDSLDYDCGDSGKHLSVGQRQLVCLARCLLRHSRFLVLDEATAAVDTETDQLIQATLRSEFNQCTVISIAHRLDTVLDYDRVMVLDQGKIAEFDAPSKLLARPDSMFFQLAKDAKLV
ncbi:canalicular multispecific organic anion transporter 2 [Aplysia californica]|uniref:Canalicular multispecific organic anion transporter 2 n=1 Tax=Aplysia californica TaxID=6500 RepID=A0ABM0K014_APLCA|nr:canalicular multispecific organic anion transporter 2 [Aplysia californica]